MDTRTDLNQMLAAVEGAGHFISGNEPERIAEEWVDEGFGVAEAAEWWKAGCFDASRTAELRDADLTPDQVSGELEGREGYSIGYWHSNMDLTLEDVLNAVLLSA